VLLITFSPHFDRLIILHLDSSWPTHSAEDSLRETQIDIRQIVDLRRIDSIGLLRMNENKQLPTLVPSQSAACSRWARGYPRSQNSSNELF
jgi:hypothetical protein